MGNAWGRSSCKEPTSRQEIADAIWTSCEHLLSELKSLPTEPTVRIFKDVTEPQALLSFGDKNQLAFLVPEGLYVPAASKNAGPAVQSDAMRLPLSFVGDGCDLPSDAPPHQ